MNDFIEWDGTENTLYELLIWWGSKAEFEHTNDCNGGCGACCKGADDWFIKSPYTIHSMTSGEVTFHGEILIGIGYNGVIEPINLGDRIYYLGDGDFLLIKKNEYWWGWA